MTMRSAPAYGQLDLAAESNHRIANSLAMVAAFARMNAASMPSNSHMMDSDEVRAILEQLGHRIDTVARLHRLLATNPPNTTIDLWEYLQDISNSVIAALSPDRARLHFACDPDCDIGPDSALLIGLIVVELVTNSIKHAHPAGVAGEIAIACSRKFDGTITIEVADDGVGLPEGFDPMRAKSHGLRLVRSLAAELTARIGFLHNPLGLSCVVQIPGEPSG